MINKEGQRRKIEGSKEESRWQIKKETEGERESWGYAKKDRRKIESRRQGK